MLAIAIEDIQALFASQPLLTGTEEGGDKLFVAKDEAGEAEDAD